VRFGDLSAEARSGDLDWTDVWGVAMGECALCYRENRSGRCSIREFL